MNYKLSLNFSNYWNIDIDEHDGKQCLIIPMKENHIFVRGNKISQRLDVFESNKLSCGSTHYAVQHISKDDYKKVKNKERMPIVANIYPMDTRFVFDKSKPLHWMEDKMGSNIDNILDL